MARNILVLTYWSFDDPLIGIYTLPYLRIIRDILPEDSRIHLLTLERDGESEQENGIEKGIFHFSFALHPFGANALFSWMKNIRKLRRFIRTNKIDTIHTWCTPAGGIGWRLSKKTGIPLVLDSFEPHADPMVETGTWKKNGIAFRVLSFLEKKQVNHAKWVIGVVPGVKKYAQEKYGYSGNNFFAKPACIDTQRFNVTERKNPELLRSLGLENKIVCVCAGKFGGLYLEEEASGFFRQAFEKWRDDFRLLLLTSAPRETVEKITGAAGIPAGNVVSLFVPNEKMPAYLGLADFAFSHYKPVPSRKYCTPIKDGEFWGVGLPVVIPAGISEDSDIIAQNNAGYVLRSFSGEEFRNAVERIDELIRKDSDGAMAKRIHELTVKHRNFTAATDIYRKIYSA
ncbi:MAG TPA: glycosyltransferase [Bacteroidia bacterium]|nr:glycosyltransferase [Bacteroidia bacterium]